MDTSNGHRYGHRPSYSDNILQDTADIGRTGSMLTPAEMTKPNPLTDFNGKLN